jgi:protein-disulfide isomerase
MHEGQRTGSPRSARLAVAMSMALAVAAAPATVWCADPPAVLATVGGKSITRKEVEERIQGKLAQIENERFDALKEALDEVIDDAVLAQEAKARNVSVDQLLKQEITDTAGAVTAEDVQKFYDWYKKEQNPEAPPLEELRSRIEQHLVGQKTQAKRTELMTSLRKKAGVKINLQRPLVKVSAEGPARGPANAPVTIVEFSDFECPFCKRAAETVEQVMKTYEGKVRLVFRHYPLPMHSNAKKAAEAASCANESGKFWPYHDLLFKNQTALAEDNLKAYAKEAGLDAGAFEKCLTSGKFATTVEKDTEEGAAAGITGTPAFFINGRPLIGAQPFEAFKEAIDDVLGQAKG